MRLPDGTILMHGTQPYDPVKAHEYYMRTRKLKGRRKASPYDQTKLDQFKKINQPKFTVVTGKGTTAQLTRKELNDQKAYAAKRVAEIKAKLGKLTAELHKMKREAQAKKQKANKKPTAADKAKAARESKQYRQKHKQQLSNKRKAAAAKAPAKSKQDPVTELEHKISRIKGALSAAVERQRALMAATRNG